MAAAIMFAPGITFAPTEQQIFLQYLIPKIQENEAALVGSPITEFDIYYKDPISTQFPGHEFFPPDEYWYFVWRVPLSPSSSKPNRFIEDLVNDGRWKQTGKPKIIKLGNTVILGKRNTLDFVTVEEKKTGWRMYEYERILEAPLFQHMVVVHIFYRLQLDQTADYMGDEYDDGEVEEMIKDG